MNLSFIPPSSSSSSSLAGLTKKDEELARLLQEEEEYTIKQIQSSPSFSPSSSSSSSSLHSHLISLHHFTLTDPTPVTNIHSLFLLYNSLFFDNELVTVAVTWSKSMRLCAGVCKYGGVGSLCEIRLSEPLLQYRSKKEQIETLLHEMIHAYLFITENETDREAHGATFQFHMKKINSTLNLNLTIYHSFHDEVDYYRTHIWRCDGICTEKKPYYGYVKRSMNRAPGPHDYWWAKHQEECGGSYIKISEPDKKEKEKEKERKKKVKKEEEKETKKKQENVKDRKAGVKQVDLIERGWVSKAKGKSKVEVPRSDENFYSSPSASSTHFPHSTVNVEQKPDGILHSDGSNKKHLQDGVEKHLLDGKEIEQDEQTESGSSSSLPNVHSSESCLINNRSLPSKRRRSEILIESSDEEENQVVSRGFKIRKEEKSSTRSEAQVNASVSENDPPLHSTPSSLFSSTVTSATIPRNTNILDLMKKKGDEKAAVSFLSKIIRAKH